MGQRKAGVDFAIRDRTIRRGGEQELCDPTGD